MNNDPSGKEFGTGLDFDITISEFSYPSPFSDSTNASFFRSIQVRRQIQILEKTFIGKQKPRNFYSEKTLKIVFNFLNV
ncbi:hypothetical protein LEP1GSC188_4356 [Leptospira weilii serovar Topaz str. LT2116]|uniref:Uncharacterized protein n=1 Tax=Leptospira weilii serovar Topaz str. LT2116 TaxID=1088540 RepID=M3FUD4_9LEPT|nr:hypothetical protein LEP1GSC188_4356 [Leptospira weilii serovar Topaz str. LT2116]